MTEQGSYQLPNARAPSRRRCHVKADVFCLGSVISINGLKPGLEDYASISTHLTTPEITGNYSYVAKGQSAMLRVTVILFALCAPGFAAAAEYDCRVEKKFDSENTYDTNQIEKGRFSVKVEESGGGAFVSRCSFSPSANKVTCDRYQVDKVVFDEKVKIKKFYVFQPQFDVQLFANLSFVENNGRGGIAYGKCRVVAP